MEVAYCVAHDLSVYSLNSLNFELSSKVNTYVGDDYCIVDNVVYMGSSQHEDLCCVVYNS